MLNQNDSPQEQKLIAGASDRPFWTEAGIVVGIIVFALTLMGFFFNFLHDADNRTAFINNGSANQAWSGKEDATR